MDNFDLAIASPGKCFSLPEKIAKGVLPLGSRCNNYILKLHAVLGQKDTLIGNVGTLSDASYDIVDAAPSFTEGNTIVGIVVV